ncbi:platelet-activating factor acetylhydrolase [Apiospora arundinis]
MEHDTVSGLVTALISTYDDGLECYTRWQRKKWQTNHYQGHSRGRESSSGSCGLSTSLMMSGSRLRQVYDGGVDVLGDAFSAGDKQCRKALQSSLKLLEAHVEVLRSAISRNNGPLELIELIRASESVRISSLRALAEQYQRVAVGRLVPRVLPTRQSPSRQPRAICSSVEADAAMDDGSHSNEDEQKRRRVGSDKGSFEGDAGHNTTSNDTASSKSRKSPCEPGPPSPPPTPKIIPDDLLSTCTSEFGPRPRASVFSVFCPEAMKYQVDLQKAIPSSSSSPLSLSNQRKENGCCSRCGYRWGDTDGTCGGIRGPISLFGNNSNKAATTAVKDGFQLTPRFLGKSHCQGGGFGCVLCTSGGKTDVYESVEDLRDHINASHDKWQMLHERDMVSR